MTWNAFFAAGVRSVVPVAASAVLAATLALASGCSTTPVGAAAQVDALQARIARLQGIQNWEASGRIALTTETQALTGSVRWRQVPDRSELMMHSALGQGSVQIVSTPHQAIAMMGTGETYTAPTAEELIERQLGYVVPVSGLQNWLVGPTLAQSRARCRIR